jgi:hypothetical protein
MLLILAKEFSRLLSIVVHVVRVHVPPHFGFPLPDKIADQRFLSPGEGVEARKDNFCRL